MPNFISLTEPYPQESGSGKTRCVKKTGPVAKDLTSVDDAKGFIDASSVAVIGFFKDTSSAAAKNFLAAANATDDYPFGITDAVFSEYNIGGETVVLFKKFDEGRADLEGEITEKSIKKFVTSQSLPLVVDFNHETAQKIFGGEMKSHLLMFLSEQEGHIDNYLEGAREIAKEFRDQVLFVKTRCVGLIVEFGGCNSEVNFGLCRI